MVKSGWVYEKTYLTNVIFRVDFPKIMEMDQTKKVPQLQERFKDIFPNFKEIPGGVIEYQLGLEDFAIKKEKRVAWEFSDKEGLKKVVITPETAILEYKKYSTFDDFLVDIKLVFDKLIELYQIKSCKRIGLRYINQITIPSGNPLDWNGYIHPSLSSVVKGFTESRDSVLRSMHLLEVQEKSNNLTFQFGLFNSEYPNPIARKEFALDLDCSSREEIPATQIYKSASEYNEVVSKWFERSITDELRRTMGGKKHAK